MKNRQKRSRNDLNVNSADERVFTGYAGRKGLHSLLHNRKFLLIGFCGILAVSFGIGTAFGIYAGRLEKSEEYLQQAAIVQSVQGDGLDDLLQEAIRLNPKDPRAYQMLARQYIWKDQQDQTNALIQQANQKLSAKERKNLDAFIAETTSEQQDWTYSVIADLGEMEMTPILLDGNAWLVQQNGKLHILEASGELADGFDYDKVILYSRYLDSESSKRQILACFPEDPVDTFNNPYWPSEKQGNFDNPCRVQCGGIGPESFYELNEQNEPVLTEASLKEVQAFLQTDTIESMIPPAPMMLPKKGDTTGSFYI